jgi:hypothetical protein
MTGGNLLSRRHSILLLSAVLFSVSTAAAAGPPEDINPRPSGDKIPEQAPGNHTDKTGGGPLSIIPGLGNKTMPDLPKQASPVAKAVTSTIGNAFESAGDVVGGIGSFLSNRLPFIGGPESAGEPISEDQPVNGTSTTQ